MKEKIDIFENILCILEDDIKLFITFKNGLFNFPFNARLQDLVGHHFAVEKLVWSFYLP